MPWKVLSIGFLSGLLVAVPLIVLLFFMDKAGRRYTVCWWCEVSAFALICFSLFAYVLSVPLYGQTTHRTSNPGGPSGSLFLVILFWILLWTVILPSFPALILLGLFPPKSYSKRRRYSLSIAIATFAAITATSIFVKYQVYMADYQQARQKQLLRRSQVQAPRQP